MTLPQIEEAFGHRFDKLFHMSTESSAKKKYLQKLSQEAADHIKTMAIKFNADEVSVQISIF